MYTFYKSNGICEAGYGPETAETVLHHPCMYVCAYDNDELVGFARALFDGLHAWIVEFCLNLRYQGTNEYGNGCFIDSDPHGIARNMAEELLRELRERGCCFFSTSVWNAGEERLYRSLGFDENKGAREFIIDERPYL